MTSVLTFVTFVYRFVLVLGVIVAGMGGAVAGWETGMLSDSLQIGIDTALDGSGIERLPVKSMEDILLLQSGVIGVKTNYDKIGEPTDFLEKQQGMDLHVRGGQRTASDWRVNGLSFHNAISGLYTASISPYAIDRFLLTSGPAAARYGGFGSGLIQIDTRGSSDELHGTIEAVTDNFATGYDQNWYTASFAAPIRGLERAGISATVERRWMGDRLPSPKTSDWLPGSPDRLPHNTLDGWSYHGKAGWQISSGTAVSVFADGSVDDWQQYRHELLFASEHNPRYKDENLGIGARVSQRLSDVGTWFFTGGYVRSERTHGDGVLSDDWEAYDRGVVNPLYDEFYLFRNTESIEPYFDYFIHYISTRVGLSTEVQFDLTSENQVSAGFDLWRYTLRYFENIMPSQPASPRRVNRYGFDSTGAVSDSEDWMNETPHPVEGGLWVMGKIRTNRVTFVPGLRGDYFDFDARTLANFDRPLGVGNSTLDPDDLVAVDAFWRFSPSLKIVVPSGDIGTLHAGFAVVHQAPPYNAVHEGWDFFEAQYNAGSWYVFGLGGVEPTRITQAEVGLVFEPADRLGVSVTGFRNDFRKLLAAYHHSAVPLSYNYLKSLGEGKTTGVELDVRVVPASSLSVFVRYTLADIQSNVSLVERPFNIAWKNSSYLPEPEVTEYSRTHSIVGIVEYSSGAAEGPRIGNVRPFEHLHASLVVRAGSGLPYTRPHGGFGEERTEWNMTVDLKIDRTFPLGNMSITPFVLVRNLFDTENITTVYSSTGEPDNTGYLDTEEGQMRAEGTNGDEFVRLYNLIQRTPLNFAPPLQTLIGIRVSF